MKRATVWLAMFAVVAVFAFAASSPGRASADSTCSPALGNCKGTPCQPPSFLGLNSWYHYLQLTVTTVGTKTECDVRFTFLSNGSQASSIPLVLLAILDDLVRIAGFAAVIFVIYGGVKYMTSQGSPEGTKQAQNTVLNAVIGLVIAILATAVVSFIGRKIAGG